MGSKWKQQPLMRLLVKYVSRIECAMLMCLKQNEQQDISKANKMNVQGLILSELGLLFASAFSNVSVIVSRKILPKSREKVSFKNRAHSEDWSFVLAWAHNGIKCDRGSLGNRVKTCLRRLVYIDFKTRLTIHLNLFSSKLYKQFLLPSSATLLPWLFISQVMVIEPSWDRWCLTKKWDFLIIVAWLVSHSCCWWDWLNCTSRCEDFTAVQTGLFFVGMLSVQIRWVVMTGTYQGSRPIHL